MIFILFNTIITIFISKKICDFMFPLRMKQIYITTGIYGLRAYASVYMFYQKVNKYLNIHKLFVKPTVVITFINNGHELKVCNLTQLKLNIGEFNNYDLILYKEPNISNDICNVIRLDSIKLINDKSISDKLLVDKLMSVKLTYNISHIKFMDISILYRGEKYNVDLSVDNYYIIGNLLLDKAFIQWYLNRFYSVIMDNVDTYTCNIMDHNINCISLSPNNYIIIEENGYTLGEKLNTNNGNIKSTIIV